MKRVIIPILMAILLVSSALPVTAADAADGVSFSSDESYLTIDPVNVTPCVFEATVCLPASAASDRGGVIIGNYGAGTSTVNFEIHSGGRPRIYWTNSDGAVKDCVFSSVNVCTGEWHRITIVRDADAEKIHCYIDGELMQTLDMKNSENITPTVSYAIGGDLRGGNAQYFKGQIKTVSLYSAVKSADEVKSGLKSDSLLLSYDLTAEGKARLGDLSGNNRHLKYVNRSDPSLNESFVDSDVKDEDSSAGISFMASDRYTLAKVLEEMPHTFEARVFFSSDTDSTQRGGVILGNYGMAGACLNFEIYSGGRPRLYFVDSGNKVYDYVFSSVNVYNGKWTDIALVCDDAAGQVHCYINGEKVQSIAYTVSEAITGNAAMAFGGDLRSGNERFFIGKILKFNLYADARSADEVLNDFNAPGGDDPMISYDTDNMAGKYIPDASENGYTAEYSATWLETVENSSYTYTLAVIGDTQIVAERAPDAFNGIYDWLLKERENMNISFAIGLGDITNGDTSAEWTLAGQAIRKLDGKIPYSLVRGNHDGAEAFNRAFPYEDYKDIVKGSYNDSLTNSWQTLTAGKVDYLVLSLDYGASDEVLTWANGVVAEHPEHQVIVTTHSWEPLKIDSRI